MTQFRTDRRFPGHSLRWSSSRRGASRRRGRSLSVEWIVLVTVLVIGSVAGFAALNFGISRQQDAVEKSVEGMNFPASSAPIVISGSASAVEPTP